MSDYLARKQDDTGVKLLWGTANLFSQSALCGGRGDQSRIPRCSRSPRPRCCQALEATQRLGGENYVLWGGREGYETLLNTDLKREREQFARFLHRWWSSTSTRSASRARC